MATVLKILYFLLVSNKACQQLLISDENNGNIFFFLNKNPVVLQRMVNGLTFYRTDVSVEI